MTDFFKPAEFADYDKWDDNYGNALESIAAIANEKLEKALGPVVYGTGDGPLDWNARSAGSLDTHTARLFNITEIKKECNHDDCAIWFYKNAERVGYKCSKCDIELKPTGWEAV